MSMRAVIYDLERIQPVTIIELHEHVQQMLQEGCRFIRFAERPKPIRWFEFSDCEAMELSFLCINVEFERMSRCIRGRDVVWGWEGFTPYEDALNLQSILLDGQLYDVMRIR